MDLVKPFPRPSSTTRPFWDGLNKREIQIQRCEGCDSWVFYPRTRCPFVLAISSYGKRFGLGSSLYLHAGAAADSPALCGGDATTAGRG
ncbi:MAG: hypothetical protein Ct9H300mP8_05000 [Gammaproteobacteria bacterium]|nr:MAG: hypothetical protein Ct9H300mP8_05000 [Gammaproteobacteria bacterium]